MAHKRPGVFKGQVRGVSHQGQEKTLHLKAEYIDADFPSFETFPLHSHGGPYIRQVRATRSNAVVEPVEGSILRIAASHEAAESLHVGEVVIACPRADGGAAVGFDEVDRPGVAVMLEVEKDARHGGSVGRWGVVPLLHLLPIE